MDGKPILYDVALSFAGEDRDYVSNVAHLLEGRGIRVFYDDFEQTDLWGKNLYQHLSKVYKDRADFAIIFISTHYARKLWAKHELVNAQARAFTESREYILPARFDDTEIPGVLPTTGYLDLRKLTPSELVDKIVAKLGRSQTAKYDRVLIEEHTRVRHGDDQPWRNAHHLTFVIRPGRKIEIEVARSRESEPKDSLEMAFMFADLIPAYHNADDRLRQLADEEHYTWLFYEKVPWGSRWSIDGRKLLLFLPMLSFSPWLSMTFHLPPRWHAGPRRRACDPSNCGGIAFTLDEP